MQFRGLGYVGFHAADPAGWLRFAVDVLGMMPARALPGEDYGMPRNPETWPKSAGSGTGPDGSVYVKMDDHQWRIAIHPSDAPRPGLAYLGLQVTDADELAAVAARIADHGVALTPATAEELAARGVQGMAWTTDPAGNRVEIFHTPMVDLGFVSPRGAGYLTGDLGLGHLLLFVADMPSNLGFYRDVLGFVRSDFFTAGPGSLHFLRCTPRHHTIGLINVGPFNAVHHLMLEMRSIDDVGAALDRAVDAGLDITQSLGRHVNDRMVSFYVRTPGGFDVEIGYDGVLCGDDWVDHQAAGGDPWGHRGLTVKGLSEFGEKNAARGG